VILFQICKKWSAIVHAGIARLKRTRLELFVVGTFAHLRLTMGNPRNFSARYLLRAWSIQLTKPALCVWCNERISPLGWHPLKANAVDLRHGSAAI
jgi:hypothetical protein